MRKFIWVLLVALSAAGAEPKALTVKELQAVDAKLVGSEVLVRGVVEAFQTWYCPRVATCKATPPDAPVLTVVDEHPAEGSLPLWIARCKGADAPRKGEHVEVRGVLKGEPGRYQLEFRAVKFLDR